MWQDFKQFFKNFMKWTIQGGIGLVALVAILGLGVHFHNNYQNTLIDSDVLACKALGKEKIPENTYYLLFSHSRAERFKDVLFFHPLSKLVPPDGDWKKTDERLSYFDFKEAFYLSYVVHLIDVVRPNVSRDKIVMYSTVGSEYADSYSMSLDREQLTLNIFNENGGNESFLACQKTDKDEIKEIVEKNKEWKNTKNKL